MFTNEIIEQVWNHSLKEEGYDFNIVRKDACGAWIIRNQYGNRDSIYGWEIDHIYPESLGGQDDIENLRAMQWENKVSKGDDYPSYKSKVQAEGSKNTHKDGQFTINEKKQEEIRNLYNIS